MKTITHEKLIPTKIITDKVFTDKVNLEAYLELCQTSMIEHFCENS